MMYFDVIFTILKNPNGEKSFFRDFLDYPCIVLYVIL